MDVTNIDNYSGIHDEFEKWYKENEENFRYNNMDEKQIAFAAWREGQRKCAEDLQDYDEWIDTAAVMPKRVGTRKGRIKNVKKMKPIVIAGEFENE